MSPEQRLIRTMVQSFAEIIERQVLRFENQSADYERKLAEHRTSFAARTSADEKIIEWLRIKVQDARAERDALRAEVAALQERLRATSEKCMHAKVGDVVSVRGYLVRTNFGEFPWEGKDCEPCDPPQTEPVPKLTHPVAVGGYLRRLTGFNATPAGEIARVTLVDDDDPRYLEYEVVRPNGEKGRWSAKGCEPCDPPATHDTPEGRSVAESVIRDGRKTELVADEIKVGDVIEVVSSTHKIYTDHEDIGRRGIVTVIDGTRISVGEVPGYMLPIRGIVGKCDVRKVTT